MTVEGLNLKYETIAASGMIEMPEIHDFHVQTLRNTQINMIMAVTPEITDMQNRGLSWNERCKRNAPPCHH